MSTQLYRKVVRRGKDNDDGETPVVVEVINTDEGTLTFVQGILDLGDVVIAYERFDKNKAVEDAVEFCKLPSEKVIAFAARAHGVQL